MHIDTRPLPLPGYDSQGPSFNDHSGNTMSKDYHNHHHPTSPTHHHSSSSLLSPPLSASPPMTDSVALPPHFNNLARNTLSRRPSVPCIQTSSEAWRAHAAEQRRQLGSESSSATASFSPNQWATQSPIELEFGESEKEPEINVNVRPSELRASLMARARRSTQQLQQRRFSGQSNQSSLGSAYDSRLSTRSSISSSISGWASRARSSSQSSQESNDSVNLDALIAEGSDINEECPIDLEDGDDVDDQQQQQLLLLQEQQQQQPEQTLLQQQEALFRAARSRTSTIGSDVNMLQYDSHGADEYWDGSDMSGRGTEDEEFDETLREFSHLNMRSSSMCEVRGLGSGSRSRAGTTSSQFADGRNPFDLNADYLDTSVGLRTTKRASTVSNYSTTSSMSSTSRLQAPGVTRSAGGAPAPKSGLKAPASRLTQPGARSMLAQPKNASSTTTTPKSGLTRPSGLQPPRTGLQPPKARSQAIRSGLQPPRAASSSALLSRGPSATKPIANGGAVPGRVSASNTGSRIAPPKGTTSLRTPAKPTATTTNVTRPASRSQIVPPGSVKKSASGIATPNRNSLLPAPSSFSSRTGPTTTAQRGAMKNTSVSRSSSSHSLMTRPPSRVSSSHYSPASSRLTSPTSTHAPHSVLTPPQSPSSKIGSRGNMNGGGIPRSGIAAPSSRLVAPAVSTSRGSRPVSPGQLSPGSSSGSQMSSFLPRSHTPTSSRPVSRIPSGLISPRAGRH